MTNPSSVRDETDTSKCVLLPLNRRDPSTVEAYGLLFRRGARWGPPYQTRSYVAQTYICLPEGWQMLDTLNKRDHAWDRIGVHRRGFETRYRAMIVDEKGRRICVVDFDPGISSGWVHIAGRYDTRAVFEDGTLKIQVMDGIEVLFETDSVPFAGDRYSADPETYDRVYSIANEWAEDKLGGQYWRTIKCDTYFNEPADDATK